MKICPVCSTEYPDDVRFCPNDGQTLRDALQAAHDLGIVHRDLKPDNIMLTRGRDGADLVKAAGIDAARAYDLVDDLFDKFRNKVLAAATIRDSALDIYRAPGVRPKDRAFAAYVASNAYARLDDRGKACQYARESARLDPDNHPYQVLQNSLCQP